MSTATSLVQRGYKNLRVFEARKEAGGRTRSYLDPKTGDLIDNGQHLLMGCYTKTLEYLKLIGSDHLIERVPLSIRFHQSGVTQILRVPPDSEPPFNLLAGMWSSNLLTAKEKFYATELGLAVESGPLPNGFEEMTCIELFRALKQPQSLIHKLWEPIVLATTNSAIDQASAVLFVNVFREVFLGEREASDFLIPTVGLSELLIYPAISFMQKEGVQVTCSMPVRSIERSEDGFTVAFDDHTETFDLVIYTGQEFDALPAGIQQGLPDRKYSTIVNAYFWIDRAIFDTPVHAFLDTTLQWAFPRASDFSSQRLALTVSAADELSARTNEEIRHILWTDLCAAIPEMRSAACIHYQIIREKRATPLLTPSIQSKRPALRSPIPNLILAGDLAQNGIPATIEGAIRNGWAAADLVPEL